MRALMKLRLPPLMAFGMRILLGLCLVLAGSLPARADDDRKDLQAQLAAAEQRDPPDQAAIAEISRRLLVLEPGDPALYEKRLRALYDLWQLKLCRKELNAWSAKQPLPDGSDIAGDLDEADEKYDAALQNWNAWLSLHPRETKTYEKIAWVYERQNRWDKADATLTKLIAIEDSASTRVWRARCRMEMRHWDDAIADINKANQLDAKDDSVKLWLPQFETLEKALPKIKALDRKIAAAKRPDASLLLDRGLLLADAGRGDLALQDADAALAANPGSKRAILQKALALIATGSPDDAAALHFIVANIIFDNKALQTIGALDAKIAAKPSDAALFTERARACSDIDQFGLALDDAREAVKLDPKSADALVELGFAEMKLDRPHEAAKDFTRATELDPKNAVAWRSLGELAMDRADYPTAIDDFSRSLQFHPSPLVMQKRAQCFLYSGRKKEADDDLRLLKKLNAPSTPFVIKK